MRLTGLALLGGALAGMACIGGVAYRASDHATTATGIAPAAGRDALGAMQDDSAETRASQDIQQVSRSVARLPTAASGVVQLLGPFGAGKHPFGGLEPGFPFTSYDLYYKLQESGAVQDIDLVEIADLTGDGRDDVIALPPYNALLVFVQDTDGTLRPPLTFVTGDDRSGVTSSKEMVLADFNEDGVTDVAATGLTGTDMLLSDGNGGLAYSSSMYIDTRWWSGVDADRDGHMDIVGYNINISCAPSACPERKIYYGDGHGAFSRRVVQRLADVGNPQGFGAHDINRDQIPDLVYQQVPTHETGTVFVEYGLPQGGYSAPAVFQPGTRLGGSLTIADLNNDRVLDTLLVDVDPYSAPEIRVRRVDGSLEAYYPLPALFVDSKFPLVADLDGDGANDIALVESRPVQGGRVPFLAVNLQRDGMFASLSISQSVNPLGTPSLSAHYMAAGDLNGDHCPDMAMASSYNGLFFVYGSDCAHRRPRMKSRDSGFVEKAP